MKRIIGFVTVAFGLFANAATTLAQARSNVWVSHGPNDVGWINDLAIADSIAYAGTINGVFLSHDRGATWQHAALEGEPIRQIAARSGASVVLAFTDRLGVYVSRDRGESWAPISAISYARAGGIDPDQPSTMYAGYDTTIWKSTDAGVTWQTLPAPGDPPFPLAFAFNSGAVYLLSYFHLFKSVDGGISWTSAQPPVNSIETIAAGAVDGVIYAAGWEGFCRSADSAATWTCLASPGFESHPRDSGSDSRQPALPRLEDNFQHRQSRHDLARETFLSRDGGATWDARERRPRGSGASLRLRRRRFVRARRHGHAGLSERKQGRHVDAVPRRIESDQDRRARPRPPASFHDLGRRDRLRTRGDRAFSVPRTAAFPGRRPAVPRVRKASTPC